MINIDNIFNFRNVISLICSLVSYFGFKKIYLLKNPNIPNNYNSKNGILYLNRKFIESFIIILLFLLFWYFLDNKQDLKNLDKNNNNMSNNNMIVLYIPPKVTENLGNNVNFQQKLLMSIDRTKLIDNFDTEKVYSEDCLFFPDIPLTTHDFQLYEKRGIYERKEIFEQMKKCIKDIPSPPKICLNYLPVLEPKALKLKDIILTLYPTISITTKKIDNKKLILSSDTENNIYLLAIDMPIKPKFEDLISFHKNNEQIDIRFNKEVLEKINVVLEKENSAKIFFNNIEDNTKTTDIKTLKNFMCTKVNCIKDSVLRQQIALNILIAIENNYLKHKVNFIPLIKKTDLDISDILDFQTFIHKIKEEKKEQFITDVNKKLDDIIKGLKDSIADEEERNPGKNHHIDPTNEKYKNITEKKDFINNNFNDILLSDNKKIGKKYQQIIEKVDELLRKMGFSYPGEEQYALEDILKTLAKVESILNNYKKYI